jgi:DNA excision repair protein ERCC-4
MSELHRLIARKALHSGNCVCVLASGLGESLTISAMIEEVNARSSRVPPLIIVVSTDSAVITGETPTEQREALYSAGGVVTVTCRVVLSDILCLRLDAALINLVIVPRAHEVNDTSNEAFFVRLFRERNGTGSLIALTDKPHGISIEQIVKTLYLSDTVLIPRFHEVCINSFSSMKDLPISQHDCSLSIRQTELQSLLESLVEASVAEIKKNKLASNLEDLDARKIIANRSELGILRRKLDPIWLRLSWTCRQVVSDVGIIRKLLVALTKYDSVTFLTILLSQQEISGKSSPWWFAQDAQRLVRVAKDRVSDLLNPDEELEPEIDSSWKSVKQIIDQLNGAPTDGAKRQRLESTKIMIISGDDLHAKQILSFVTEGAKRCLLESLERQECGLFPKPLVKQAIDSLNIEPSYSNIIIRTSGNSERADELFEDLNQFEPQVVILMEPSLVAIRCIETYRLNRPSIQHVDILGHSASLVEPKIPDLIAREAKAFDDMIRLKSTLTFYAKNELYENKIRQETKQVLASTSSRQGGRRKMTVSEMLKQTVLVDTRELRSALPFMLYKKHIEIYPTTLTIGDYVLSRDIAVERKSVTGSDLQQSLISGRLYKQLVNLTHAFPWPILLLEFSTGKTFQLQSTETASGEINPASLIAQIIAIVIHFPSVRLIWSPTFAFTANVFTRLKQGREQPRVDIGSREPMLGTDPSSQGANTAAKRAVEFLKACPGITAANLPVLMKSARSIREIAQMDVDSLVRLLGKRDGHLFHKFINFKF